MASRRFRYYGTEQYNSTVVYRFRDRVRSAPIRTLTDPVHIRRSWQRSWHMVGRGGRTTPQYLEMVRDYALENHHPWVPLHEDEVNDFLRKIDRMRELEVGPDPGY